MITCKEVYNAVSGLFSGFIGRLCICILLEHNFFAFVWKEILLLGSHGGEGGGTIGYVLGCFVENLLFTCVALRFVEDDRRCLLFSLMLVG